MDNLPKINLVSRYGLAFVFFYQGLVPKLLWLSPIERRLVIAHDLGISVVLVSTIAGMLEIMLAFVIVYYKQSLMPIYISAALLLGLLLDVGIVASDIFISAFNPVSVNVATLVLCYVIYLSHINK